MTLDRTQIPQSKEITYFALPQTTKYLLNNGMPVYTLSSGSQKILRIEWIIEAGTRFDTVPGVSQIALKMLNEGTTKLSANQIAEEVASKGAFLELHHGIDRINITLYCLNDFLSILLPTLADIIFNSIFPEKEFEKLINISTQSLKVNEEKTSYLATKAFKANLYENGHPYGYSLSTDDLKNLTRSQVFDYYQQFIQKLNGASIMVAGSFNESEVVALLNKYFGGVLYNKSEKQSFIVKNLSYKTIHLSKDEALQTSIRIGRHVMSRHDDDHIDFIISNELLGGFFGSRLMKNIREDKGYTYGISSQINFLNQSSYMLIGADIKKEALADTLVQIEIEFEKLKKEPVSEEELNILRNYMLGSYLNNISTSFQQMDKFKMLYFNGLEYSYFENYFNGIKNISVEKIQTIANKYFNIESMLVLSVG